MSFPTMQVHRVKSHVLDDKKAANTILLIDDHGIVRLATKFLVEQILDDAMVLEASTFQEAIAQLEMHTVQLALLDICLPDGEGLDMISKFRSIQPAALILVFTARDEAVYGLHYLKAGANGFLAKNSPESEIKKAILAVLNGGSFVEKGRDLTPITRS